MSLSIMGSCVFFGVVFRRRMKDDNFRDKLRFRVGFLPVPCLFLSGAGDLPFPSSAKKFDVSSFLFELTQLDG